MEGGPTLEERKVLALEEIAESLDALVSIVEEYAQKTGPRGIGIMHNPILASREPSVHGEGE